MSPWVGMYLSDILQFAHVNSRLPRDGTALLCGSVIEESTEDDVIVHLRDSID